MNSQMLPNEALQISLDQRSLLLRKNIIEYSLMHAKRGHLGPSFSVVDILRVLYDDIVRVDPAQPDSADRDIVLLSKGHGGLALYSILAEHGFFPKAELATFCEKNSRLGVHPDAMKVPGVEASTGSLGHGPSIGLGFALHFVAQNMTNRVYVIVGDGEINEGSVWEAALTASKYKLENYTIVVDYNRMQACGYIEDILPLENISGKFSSFGFSVIECNGHDVAAMNRIFKSLPLSPDKPTAIICHTIKGKGVSDAENNIDWHHQNKMDAADLNRFLCEIEGKMR